MVSNARQIASFPAPTFRAHLSANQTGVSDATFTKVQFDTEDWDTHGYCDNSTNYRFTPLIAGYYLFTAVVGYGGTGASQTAVSVYKNGSYYQSGDNDYVSYTNNASGLINMNGSSDYIEIYAYANVSSGTAHFIGASGGGYTNFTATLQVRT